MSWASAIVMGAKAVGAAKSLYKSGKGVVQANQNYQHKQQKPVKSVAKKAPVQQTKPKQQLKPSAPQKSNPAPSPAKKPAPVQPAKPAKPAQAKGTKKVK